MLLNLLFTLFCREIFAKIYANFMWRKIEPSLVLVLVFSDLFHDGTISNAQNHELKRSRPVNMLKLNIFVTLSMMETMMVGMAGLVGLVGMVGLVVW